ncbi:MAG: prolyl oligopeptidase family protein [Planctomycetota bacterium]|jgi:prolyl oligopeptidase
MEDDPYLWLEEVLGEKSLEWVKERNAESRVLSDNEVFGKLEERIRGILDSESKIPYVQKIGDRYYNFWRDAGHPRGLWRRTTLEEYRKADPDWETVIDLDALAEAEGENWVWHGCNVLMPGADRGIVSLSRGGGDADVKREFDLAIKDFVEGGYSLPEAKSQLAWRGPDSMFVATDFGPETLTDSGYPRIVKAWKRGTPLEEATPVFEVGVKDMVVGAYTDLTPGFERDIVARAVTFFEKEFHLWRDGELVRIDVPGDAEISFHREWLLITCRNDWAVGGATIPAGTLIAIPLEDFLAGDRRFSVLMEPTERSSLAAFSSTRNHVLLNVLDNVANKLFVLTPPETGRDWTRTPLPGVPEQATAGARPVDRFESDDYFLDVTGFLTPSTVSLGQVGKGPAELLKSGPAFFETEGLHVTRHEVLSKDGTAIPYFQVGQKALPLDGTNKTLLTGYGGFEVSMVPFYNPMAGAGWLEEGGVLVARRIDTRSMKISSP